jgi:NAD(P)-dependent dehydrogenase (short-subunit alcohol dehydrogenase family)
VTLQGELPFSGRVALVTGAARGLGLAIAEALASQGADLELCDIDGSAVKAAAEALLPASGNAVASKVDISLPEQVRDWIDDVALRRKRIDILINNAGVQLNRAATELSDEDWQRVIATNLNGAFSCSREAGRHMQAQKRGAIVNISSIAERFGMPRRLPYSVSKAGLSALTRGLAAEWAEHGVRVNAVAPGYVETDLVRHAFEQGHIDRSGIVAKIPLGFLAQPRSVADAVVFLVSDRADYITGQTLYVDGGYSVHK